ncbi:MAG: MATE family efflux transporter [Hyphomicrobiales bacterium]|nr:MATE family efflux transporter [Hyphomicrobiales bacterium]
MTPTDIALAPTVHGYWRQETVETIKLALPMAFTQLGQIAMLTTDLILIGQLGGEAVAAVALAHTLFFISYVLGLGVVSAVAPLTAQAYGARNPRMTRRSLRVGLWAALLIGAPLTAALHWGEAMLLALGQPPQAATQAGLYLAGLAWSLAPGWAFVALRSFMGAVNRPAPGLWIMLTAIPINGALAYALIHGAFEAPQLGIYGAGIATAIVNVVMCGFGIWAAYAMHPFKKYNVMGRFWRLDWPLMRKLLAVGVPISGAFLLEYGVFAASSLLMGYISITALAAHQIALQVASIIFMIPFGIGQAATVRVGHAAGRGDPEAIRRAGLTAIAMAIIFMTAMTVIIAINRHLIPGLFLNETVAATDETAALAATLLLVGMTFFIADGTQTVAAGALRGLNDTKLPLVAAFISFWIIGFSAAYWLAFTAGLGAAGVWIGLTCGLFVYAGMLVTRFVWLTRNI